MKFELPEANAEVRLTLSSNDVHIWRAALDQPALCVEKLAQTLSEEEHTRAERFHFQRDRRRFIVGRGVLRTTLALYLGTDPSQLKFCHGPYGKPHLAAPTYGAGDALRFNLAHSHELALYAFTRGREIGVDLEYIRRALDVGQIAARFFSSGENAVLDALPTDQKQEAFFNCWTRKEAYIKAIGDGLAQPLHQFDVSLAPGKPARLLSVKGDPEEASRWSLKALIPAPDYVAALAVEGHGWELQCWQWPLTGF